jgi:hypothetical protein
VGGREATLHSSTPARHLSTPTPNPSPQGGGERAASASTQRKSILATPARPSYANAIRKQLPRSRIASRLNRRWDRLSARSCSSVLFEHDLFGKPVSTFPDHARQTKGKRNAGRRISPNLRAIRARLARSVARSPVGVPPRRLLQRTNAAAQLQNALPGTWSERTIPMVRKIVRFSTGVTRSFLSQSSDQVADRSSCRPGVFPKPPGSGGDEPPPAGTALAPSAGVAG